MASSPGDEEETFDRIIGAPGTVSETGACKEEKEISRAASLPGWTIMRPLRKRGNNSSATATETDTNSNGITSVDNKTIGELRVTETNVSGSAVGDIEVLHELRSDDELLGDDEEGQGRAVQENRNPGDHTLQSNDGTNEERAFNGGGEYKVYRRRWFGLVQLVLLNIIVSWDVSLSASRKQSCTRQQQLMNLLPVADFRCEFDHGFPILQCFGKRNQLA